MQRAELEMSCLHVAAHERGVACWLRKLRCWRRSDAACSSGRAPGRRCARPGTPARGAATARCWFLRDVAAARRISATAQRHDLRMLRARNASPSGSRSVARQARWSRRRWCTAGRTPDHLLEGLRAVVADRHPVAVRTFADAVGAAKRPAHPGPDRRGHYERHVAVGVRRHKGIPRRALSRTVGPRPRGHEDRSSSGRRRDPTEVLLLDVGGGELHGRTRKREPIDQPIEPGVVDAPFS